MPLLKSKSKTAFSHNVGAEMKAGKPQKQSLAIAYATKRAAQRRAHGGEIAADTVRPDVGWGKVTVKAAHGGEIEHNEPMEGDTDNFLSPEDALETPFHSDSMSDTAELEESGQEVHAHMDNEEAPVPEEEDKGHVLDGIMRKMRMRHMGKV